MSPPKYPPSKSAAYSNPAVCPSPLSRLSVSSKSWLASGNSNAIKIPEIMKNHFQEFENCYEEKYADKYGKFSIIRIKEAVLEFLDCGDYSKGIARIRCTNPECGYDYFRPFSCKAWYLCSSCHQKRILLFSEHMANDVLLRLPHRQYVWTIPKALRVYFKHEKYSALYGKRFYCRAYNAYSTSA